MVICLDLRISFKMQLTFSMGPDRPYTKPLDTIEPSMILMNGQTIKNKGNNAGGILPENNFIQTKDKRLYEPVPAYTTSCAPNLTSFEFGQPQSSQFPVRPSFTPFQYLSPFPWVQYPNYTTSQLPYWNQAGCRGVLSNEPGLTSISFSPAENQTNLSPIITSDFTQNFFTPRVESSFTLYNISTNRSNKVLDINKPKPEDPDPFLSANYKYRNVFKAVIRRMHICVRKKKNELMLQLKEANFTTSEIERAFTRIACYKNAERKSGKKRMSVRMIKEATQQRSVYTLILREALTSMLTDWNMGKLGRLTIRNVDTYKKVCENYLNQIKELLNN